MDNLDDCTWPPPVTVPQEVERLGLAPGQWLCAQDPF